MTTVQLFITCLVDSFYPQTGEAIVSILRRLGLTVDFPPDQTCCGQPPFNAGLRTEARPIVEHTIRVFEKTDGDIVIPSGSCAHMIKHGYPELFQEDPHWLPRAQLIGSRVYEFTEYLVDKLGVTDLGAYWNGTSPIIHPVTPCAACTSTASRAYCWQTSVGHRSLTYRIRKNAADLAESSRWNTPSSPRSG